jgi:hypothetical protein
MRYGCTYCGDPVAEDLEYGSYVHLDADGNTDRVERDHYADPDYTSEAAWLESKQPGAWE